MQAMQRQLQLLPPQEGSAFVRADTYLYAIEPPIWNLLGTLQRQKEFAQQFASPGQEIRLNLRLIDSATFGTVLTCLRASLGDADYSQRVSNVTKILQHTTAKQANNILHALDFLDAKQNPLDTALLLRYAAVNPTIACHLGKSYDELPQDIRAVVSSGAYNRLDSRLRHTLKNPNFTKKDPPQSFPPLAQETLQSKRTQTPEEIQGLLQEQTDWRFLAYLPGSAGLTELWIHNNKLELLPPEIGALVNLVKLNLSDNQLTLLPPEIGGLTGLQKLWLQNNKLTLLPPEIGGLTGLQVLRLENNQLRSLPPSICGLAGLRELSLYSNQLTSLPLSIGRLNLRKLLLSSNELTRDQLRRIGNALPDNCLILAYDQHPSS